MGLWQDDNRHGNGIVVTLDGMYFEGNFVQGKLSVSIFASCFFFVLFCFSIRVFSITFLFSLKCSSAVNKKKKKTVTN